MLFTGELTKEEDNQFIRWLYRTRHISSISALRASADVADARLEQKLRYENANVEKREGRMTEVCIARSALSANINVIGGARTEMGPFARMMVSHD